ncbi:MAG: signal recognition particle subunit SRP54 [Candidatus Tokpelaia sp. JSC085]|nr:MAG: signal recognition particle subunit SRP54 [Candidatus Tokpelaia sp. JSC085]
MFESLQERLSCVFDKLIGRGLLSEQEVGTALQEVRRALIDADVSLEVVRSFIEKVREKAVGAKLLKTIQPGQMVVKIVHDQLVEMLGGNGVNIDLNAPDPVVIMLVGIQGAGKTTTAAKVAVRLRDKQDRRVLMASLDTSRPAAQEQLRQLGEQVGVSTLPIVTGQAPIEIASRAIKAARLCGQNLVILDTAGRSHINKLLMEEVIDIKTRIKPHEIFLIADSLTGQDAVNLARSFDEYVGITGIILTRMDGDGRGGAALSMRAVTGKPIKAIATGEKMDALEEFHPQRIADRILGMGDVVSLVEKAAAAIDSEHAINLSKKAHKDNTFDLNDFAHQLHQVKKIGGLSSIIGLLPGMSRMKDRFTVAGLDDSILTRQLAIISSMTHKERANPDILKHSRKQRVAKGSGTTAAEINKLLKMHRQMANAIKVMGRKGGSMLGQMIGDLGLNTGFGGADDGIPDLSSIDMKQLEPLKKMGRTYKVRQ